MGDRIKYEKPVLIDMALGSVLGVTAECNGGYAQNSCTQGSCVSKGFCQWGNWTGYCNSGTGACGNTYSCYCCCEEGAMIGTGGICAGAMGLCNCSTGSNAGALCITGTRTSWVCMTGSNYTSECQY